MEPSSREILTRDKIPSRRRQGLIGLYHPFKGRVYAGAGVDEDLYEAYLFGLPDLAPWPPESS